MPGATRPRHHAPPAQTAVLAARLVVPGTVPARPAALISRSRLFIAPTSRGRALLRPVPEAVGGQGPGGTPPSREGWRAT